MHKVFCVALSLVLAGAIFVARSSAEENASATVGQPAPQFALQDHNGNTVNLSDHAGKVIVLEWFNNQCPFVVKFYGNGKMNEIAKSYADKGVVWLAINSGKNTTNESNAAVAAEWNIERPILNDSTGDVGRAYGATNTPHMYVIDTHGNLVYMGAIDSISSSDSADIDKAENYVVKALDETLSGTSVTTPQTKAYGCSVKY